MLKSTNSRGNVFIIHTERIGVSTAMQDCRLGHRALERFNYSSREIIQPLHDSLSTHALEVTKLQSCLAFNSVLCWMKL